MVLKSGSLVTSSVDVDGWIECWGRDMSLGNVFWKGVLSLDLPLWLFCFQLPWGEQLYSGTPSLPTTVFCFITSPQRWGICGRKPETMSPKKSFPQVFCHSNEKWLSLHLVSETTVPRWESVFWSSGSLVSELELVLHMRPSCSPSIMKRGCGMATSCLCFRVEAVASPVLSKNSTE